MNRNAILNKRQKQFIERIAWGASYKEVADFFHVSWSTVDNTLRNAKTKLGLSKVTELGAWWFCTNYGISFDLSPIARQCTAGVILLLFSLGEVTTVTNISYTMQRVRRPRTEYRIRRHETSIYQPYIIN